MKDAEMDQILCKQDEILPSSGFTAAVMEAVRREAAAPAPIPFPWKRALPVMILAAIVLVAVVVGGVAVLVQISRGSLVANLPAAPSPALAPLFQGGTGSVIVWTGLALLTALVAVKLSMRAVGGRA